MSSSLASPSSDEGSLEPQHRAVEDLGVYLLLFVYPAFDILLIPLLFSSAVYWSLTRELVKAACRASFLLSSTALAIGGGEARIAADFSLSHARDGQDLSHPVHGVNKTLIKNLFALGWP